MRRRVTFFAILTVFVALVTAAVAIAGPGGMPAAHGTDGPGFGQAVSGLAKSAPGAVAGHVTAGAGAGAAAETGGGMPAVHGVDGATFGGLVSDLARSAPGAVAEHVAGAAGPSAGAKVSNATATAGLPAAHGLSGRQFGEAVSGLATADPAALVDHITSAVGDGASGDGVGLPAAHDMDGASFGTAVREAAQADPAALVEHITGAVRGR